MLTLLGEEYQTWCTLFSRIIGNLAETPEQIEKAQSTAKDVPDERKISKGYLVRLRRLAQDNQKSHKLEPRWEGPYRVQKAQSFHIFI